MIPNFHKMSTFGVDMNIFQTMNDLSPVGCSNVIPNWQ